MWCWARPDRNTCECALHVREHVQNTGAELTRDITAAMQGARTQGLTHEHNHMSKWDGGNNDCAPWDMQLRWLTGVRQPEVNHSFQVWFVTLLVIVITLLRRHIRRRQRHNWLSEPMRQWVSAWWQTAGKKTDRFIVMFSFLWAVEVEVLSCFWVNKLGLWTQFFYLHVVHETFADCVSQSGLIGTIWSPSFWEYSTGWQEGSHKKTQHMRTN